MWGQNTYYDNDSSSDGYPDQDEVTDPYDPSDMTSCCYYRCGWNDDWCNFDATKPQLNWSRTANSSAADPVLPPGVTRKVRISCYCCEKQQVVDDLDCARMHLCI